MPTTNDWINRATGKSGTQAGGGAAGGAVGGSGRTSKGGIPRAGGAADGVVGGAIGGRSGQPKPPITKGLANVGPNATPFQQRQPGEMGTFDYIDRNGNRQQGAPPSRDLTEGHDGKLRPRLPGDGTVGVDPLTQRFPDSYQVLLDSMRSGRGGDGLMQDLLAGFKGRGGDLKSFMESPAFRTVMAYSQKNSDAYKNFASLEDPTLQSMNVGLGQISQAGARGIQDAMGSLNASGMGRNAGAVAAAKSGIGLETAGKQASYQSAMQQAAYQNQVAKLGTLMDLEQQMAQLALGYNPQPRQPSGKASTGDWLALAGSMAGTGAAIGGPWGAAIGGAVGLVAGAFQ